MGYTAFDRFVALWRFRAALPYIHKDARVCDIGSGPEAAFLRKGASRILFGVGIDRLMPPLKPAGFSYVISDMTLGLPFRSNEFHHVVMLAVLEHLAQPERVIEEAFRILIPGGSLIITWPSAAVDPILKVLQFAGLVSRELGLEQHQPRLPVKTLVSLLQKIGFKQPFHRRFELALNNLLVAIKSTESLS